MKEFRLELVEKIRLIPLPEKRIYLSYKYSTIGSSNSPSLIENLRRYEWAYVDSYYFLMITLSNWYAFGIRNEPSELVSEVQCFIFKKGKWVGIDKSELRKITKGLALDWNEIEIPEI